MTATGSKYRVIVRVSEREPGRLVYELARQVEFGQLVAQHARRDPDRAALMDGAIDPQHEVWDPMEPLTTPWCTRVQARQMAQTWLYLTGDEPVPADAVVFVWAVGEPDTAVRSVASAEAHYGRMRQAYYGQAQRAWWRRVLRRQA